MSDRRPVRLRPVRLGDGARWVLWSSKVVLRGAADLARLVAAGGLPDAMRPWMTFPSAGRVPYDRLAAEGVKAVLFDLENTLIPPGGPFTPEGRAVVAAVREAGLAVGVVSNCSASWVAAALEPEEVPFVAPAGKPGPRAFLAGCEMLGVQPGEAVYIGDQVITDVLGSQRAGLRAILLEPQYTSEAWSSKGQRLLVRVLQRLWPDRKEPRR